MTELEEITALAWIELRRCLIRYTLPLSLFTYIIYKL